MRIIIEDNSVFNKEFFGGIDFYRPRVSAEIENRTEVEQHLRAKYNVGIYKKPKEINEIIQHIFSFYENKLQEIIPQIASRHFLEFLFFQYDQSCLINSLHKKNSLSASEARRWHQIGAKSRRAIKYMAERVVILHPSEEPAALKPKLLNLLDSLWISTEEMVELYMLSDQTITIFPNESTLEILPSGSEIFFKLSLAREFDFLELINRDRKNKSVYLGAALSSYESNILEHDSILASSMIQDIGLSYKGCLSLIAQLMNDCQPVPNGFPVIFVNENHLVTQISDFLRTSPEVVRKVLSGFIVSKENMELEGRQIWKPKQEYRAFRRGFFSLPYEDNLHIAFSRSMAHECFMFLLTSTIYQHLPSEWLTPNIKKSLAEISNKAGKWFEGVVIDNIKKIGVLGRSYKNKIGDSRGFISIPHEVGEIDFLGYSEKEGMLFLLECKMVNSGTEPKFFRKDIDAFVLREKSYLAQYEKKHEWVVQNIERIIEILNLTNEFGQRIERNKLATAFITASPNIAMYFIPKYPCVSITNLMLDYDAKNSWPYTLGVIDL